MLNGSPTSRRQTFHPGYIPLSVYFSTWDSNPTRLQSEFASNLLKYFASLPKDVVDVDTSPRTSFRPLSLLESARNG